jgi:hypothetical protein
MAEIKMSIVETTQPNGRRIVTEGGRSRVALPLAYTEHCLSEIEADFLHRFYEAYRFTMGDNPVNAEGEPNGRYADYTAEVEPEAYRRLEVNAFQWVRRYELDPDWLRRAEIFLRMQDERSSITVSEMGAHHVNTQDARVALGAGQSMIRDLGKVLKLAYRNFFRWYGYVQTEEAKGRTPTPEGALAVLTREKSISNKIEQFKLARGLNPPVDPTLD